MSASGVSTQKITDGNVNPSEFSQARWLAWRDIRRTWLSYPLSGLFMLFLGFLSLSVMWGLKTQEVNGVQNLPQAIFFADYLYVIVGCILVVNAASMDYLKVWTSDVFSERMAFLLSLPLSTGTLVASRIISMLFAIPFTVPAFFLPAYFFTDLGWDLGPSYVWFVGIWLGWGLLYAGVTLFCEFGMSGRAYCWISFGIIAAIFIGLILISVTFGDVSLIRGVEALAADYGPLAALASLLIGATGFWFLARLTIRRVERREVGA